MAKKPLPRYEFVKDSRAGDWTLKNIDSGRVVRRYDTKTEGTAGGVLGNALGSNGGSVRIKKENGRIQEERTFPRSADPKKTEG